MSQEQDRTGISNGPNLERDEGAECANCDTALTGPYCSNCGQSSDDIRRPAWTLLTDLAGSVLAWEGRFFTTVHDLFARPGLVARQYVDGKRNAYTAPIRIYLIVSVIFFLLMSLAGVRVIGVSLGPDGNTIRAQDTARIAERVERIALAAAAETDADISLDDSVTDSSAPSADICGVMPGPDEINARGQLVYARDTSVQIQLIQFGDPPEGRILPDQPGCATEFGADGEWMGFGPASRFAIQNPVIFEDRVNAAATQTLILMVLAFALMNLIVHPRRQMIEHAVYSLYWHAIYLPIYAALILAAKFMNGNLPGVIILSAVGVFGVITLQVLNDRGFYGSSWMGSILRSLLLQFLYVLAVALLALGLIITSV